MRFSPDKRHVLVALASLSFSVASGCSSSEPIASGDDDIIGGRDAFDPALDGVARLTTPQATFCAATLVAPQLLVTAAHCVEGYDGRGQERSISATFTSYAPNGGITTTRSFDAAAVLRFGAEKRPDNSLPFGIDIALVMLKEPVPASVAKPIPVRATTLGEADVGDAFVQVGYGQTNPNAGTSWSQPRQMGDVVLKAVSGHMFQKMFPSRSAFDAYLEQIESAKFVSDRGDELWSHELSEYGQEVQVGGDTKGPQGCYGDSGGPLLQRKGDHYELVAVVSNGPEGYANPCILGERFVRTGDQVIAAVTARASRTDPWALVPCDSGDEGVSSCAASGELTTCRRTWSNVAEHRNLRQRVERCEDRSLTCKVVGDGAGCQ